MISGFLTSLLLIATASGNDCPTDLERLLDRLASPDGQPLAFVEERQSGLLTEPQVVTGTLHRDDDGALVRRVTQPVQETQILTASHVEVRRPDGFRQRFSLSRAPELATLRHALDSLLSGQPEQLRNTFALALADPPQEGHWQLELTPLDEALAKRVVKLTVHGIDKRIAAFEMHLDDGEIIRTEIEPAP